MAKSKRSDNRYDRGRLTFTQQELVAHVTGIALCKGQGASGWRGWGGVVGVYVTVHRVRHVAGRDAQPRKATARTCVVSGWHASSSCFSRQQLWTGRKGQRC